MNPSAPNGGSKGSGGWPIHELCNAPGEGSTRCARVGEEQASTADHAVQPTCATYRRGHRHTTGPRRCARAGRWSVAWSVASAVVGVFVGGRVVEVLDGSADVGAAD